VDNHTQLEPNRGRPDRSLTATPDDGPGPFRPGLQIPDIHEPASDLMMAGSGSLCGVLAKKLDVELDLANRRNLM
jgi:hypothetical protein